MQTPDTTPPPLAELITHFVSGEPPLFEWLEIIHDTPREPSYLNGFIGKVVEKGFRIGISFDLLHLVAMEAVRQTGLSYTPEKAKRHIAMRYAGMITREEDKQERANGRPLTNEEHTIRFNKYLEELTARLTAPP